MKFTVHVEYSDGSKASNSKVFLDIHGWLAGTWLKGYTDKNGDVSFNLGRGNGVEITFFVNGAKYQTDTVSDGDCVYITI